MYSINDKNSQRILWVDYAKVICIFLMVVGHSGLDAINLTFRGFFYYFHIPCFFILSGYLNNPKKLSVLLHSLLIPVFVFNLLNYPWYVYNLWHHHAVFDIHTLLLQPLLGLWLHDMNIGIPLCGPFWFVIVLLLDKLVVDCLGLYKKSYILTIFSILCILVVYVFPNLFETKWLFLINKGIISFPFFALGVIIKEMNLEQKFKNAIEINTLRIIIGGGIFILLLLFYYINGLVDIYQGKLGNVLLYYGGGIIGSFGVYLVSNLLANNISRTKEIIELSKGTLVILGFHSVVLFGIKKCLLFHIYFENQGIIMAIFTIIILYPIILLFNHKYQYLLGKRK